MIFIVLPAYNEALNIAAVVGEIRDVLTRRGELFRVVVVNDGSTDATREVAGELEKNLPLHGINFEKNRGVDAVFRAGIDWVCAQAAEEDILISLDCDRTHPASAMPLMLEALRQGNDIAIASRYHPESITTQLPWKREVLSNVINAMLKCLFPLDNARDYTTFYRAYRVGILKKALDLFRADFIQSKGFPCVAEILIKLRYFRPRVAEVPLNLRFDRRTGKSKMKILNTVFSYAELIMREFRNRFQRRFSKIR
ncbi:MAG: glycosyltransferase family 2 protein [Candidatus Omnitrophica bacterium]|jgi:Glycosyltransferases involved in cell wall biogenesis|nr:glycosyltransferase family 2 protein [Candidatus Omnitrophota bacterium]